MLIPDSLLFHSKEPLACGLSPVQRGSDLPIQTGRFRVSARGLLGATTTFTDNMPKPSYRVSAKDYFGNGLHRFAVW